MEIGRFKFHRRASTAFNELSSGDQARVLESVAPLAGTPLQQWPPRMVKKLRSDPDLYLLRIDDSLRAIVRAPEGIDPEILDLVRHETLESFAKAGS
jgi:hypothetical protein